MSRYALLLVGVTLWSIPARGGSEDPKPATPPAPKSKAKPPATAKKSVGILGVLAAPRPNEATFDFGPIKGPLQLADLQRATFGRRVEVESCARIQRNGKLVLALFVRPDGSVFARRLHTTFKQVWVASCIQRELQRMQLDPLGAPSELTLTVRFRPRPAALGGLMGNQIGGSFGAGGLGLRGSGRGGGGLGLGGSGRKDPGRVLADKPTINGADRPYREMIRRVVRRHNNLVRYCYEKELTRDPGLAGRLVVLFTIDTEGHVAKASLASSTLSRAEVGNCVIRAALRWRFPRPRHPVQVSYPFVFRNEGYTAKGGTLPRVTVEKPQLNSGYPKEIIRRVIRTHVAELRGCYQRVLTKQMRPSDRLVVAFTIDGKGGVARASIASSTLNLPAMHECVLGAVRSWRFPAPEGGGIVQVSYPFVFRPEM